MAIFDSFHWKNILINRSALSIVLGSLVCVCASLSYASDESVDDDPDAWNLSSTKGLRWHSTRRDTELRVGGRLHVDSARFEDDLTPIESDSAFRRARVYVAAKVGDHWRFRIEREFANDREGWRNLWARYNFGKKAWVKAGNFVAPFGLEDVAASNHATFMERSLPSALAPSFQTGLAFGTRNRFGNARRRHHYSWVVSVGGEPMGDDMEDRHRSNHRSVVSRFAYAPIAEDDRLVHFALAAEHREIDRGSPYRVRSRPESSLAPGLLNTGLLADVDSVRSFGIESAAVYGAFSTQAEYMQTTLKRSAGRADPTFNGWYLQASYALTGEHRNYSRSSGSFSGIEPNGRWGAVEIAVRASQLDLIDETVRGGEARDLTLGVNWYVNANVRLMFNYVAVDAKRRSDFLKDQPSIYQFRLLAFL